MCCGEESVQARTFQTSPTPHPPPVAFPCFLEIFYDSGTTSPIRLWSEKMTEIIHLETLSILRRETNLLLKYSSLFEMFQKIWPIWAAVNKLMTEKPGTNRDIRINRFCLYHLEILMLHLFLKCVHCKEVTIVLGINLTYLFKNHCIDTFLYIAFLFPQYYVHNFISILLCYQ